MPPQDLSQGRPGRRGPAIQLCLQRGRRGLPRGSSLKPLLGERRGTRYSRGMPLSVAGILAWADAHYIADRRWPRRDSGAIVGTLGETWGRVVKALEGRPSRDWNGWLLPGETTGEHRSVRNTRDLPDLDVATILSWADAHHERTGKWPNWNSGSVREAPRLARTGPGMTVALYQGRRGFPAGSSFAQLLDQHRTVRNIRGLPPLTIETVLASAETYHQPQTAWWPTNKSGAILDATGETWMTVDKALRRGRRGLAGDSSLARLLSQHRRKRERNDGPA